MQTERKTKYYLDFSEVQPNFKQRQQIKGSANRMKFQKYLRISEMQPTFNFKLKVVQLTTEWQRGVKALLATEGTLVPQRSIKLG